MDEDRAETTTSAEDLDFAEWYEQNLGENATWRFPQRKESADAD